MSLCYTKYPHLLFLPMNPSEFPVSDIEKFAEYLGLDGIDSDLFYESYYELDEYDGYDSEWIETAEHYAMIIN